MLSLLKKEISKGSDEQPEFVKPKQEAKIILALFLLFFGVILVRTAWISDDAYITFRTVDNFIHGYGLTWNIDERVQAYTNPLWMLTVSFFYLFTKEAFYTSIVLQLIISFGAVYILSTKVARSTGLAILGLIILSFSKAFVDYSTSGLENPLSHLIFIMFLVLYFKYETFGRRQILLASFLVALAMVNRMDTVLLLFPALCYIILLRRDKELSFLGGIGAGLWGFLPFITWELFSIIYYGFPFPNTAYAKLNTGISTTEYIQQGLFYYLNSIDVDPLTLLAISFGLCIPFLTKVKKEFPVAIGIGLYLLYIVKIGGDFMSGRFLAAPMFLAVSLITRSQLRFSRSVLAGLLITAVGLSASYPILQSNSEYGSNQKLGDQKGINDERGFYYRQGTGLLGDNRTVQMPNIGLVDEGKLAAEEAGQDGHKAVVEGSVGFFGFYAGPRIHVIDYLALADPLLARLPALHNETWRIGHFTRVIPEGYQDTIESGQNRFKDKDLGQYYDKLSLIIRGNLFDPKRLKTIISMNLGRYNYLIYTDGFKYANMKKIDLLQLGSTPWNRKEDVIFDNGGIQINIGNSQKSKAIDLGLSYNGVYKLVYLHGGKEVGEQRLRKVPPSVKINIPDNAPNAKKILEKFSILVPQSVQNSGFDQLRVFPVEGDNSYNLGYVRFTN